MDIESAILPNHHIQKELCETRPIYRQGRKLTAIKVYTIHSESQHLYIYGVPSLNLRTELKNLCTKYGQVEYIHVVSDVVVEQFTECYHVCFKRIQSARVSKRLLDDKNFYGGVLHVCYAPEYETVAETRQKLDNRRQEVQLRIEGNASCFNQVEEHHFTDSPASAPISITNPHSKRKYVNTAQNTCTLKKMKINSEESRCLERSPLILNIGPQICDFPSRDVSKNDNGNDSVTSEFKSKNDKPSDSSMLIHNSIKENKIKLRDNLVKLL